MKNEDKVMLAEKIRNLTFIVVLGFVIVFMLLIGLYIKGGSSDSGSSNTGTSQGGSSSSSSYDVSKMNAIAEDEIDTLLSDKKTHIVYIGRSTCSVCVQTVPVLNQVQSDLGFTLDYIPLELKNSESDSGEGHAFSTWVTYMRNLIDAMKDVDATVNGEDGTLGGLFEAHGYTPVVVVIENGKVVDGFIGYRSADAMKEIFNKYLK